MDLSLIKGRIFVSQWLATIVLHFSLKSYPKYTIDDGSYHTQIGHRCRKNNNKGFTAAHYPGEQATKYRSISPCQLAVRVLFSPQEGRPSFLRKLVVVHPCRPHQRLAPGSRRFPTIRRCLSDGPRHNGVSSSLHGSTVTSMTAILTKLE